MSFLLQTARVCRHTVGHLCSPPLLPKFICIEGRSLSTSQWKKYLSILDVSKTSTPKEIKESFLRLSKIYHPDNKVTGSHMKFVELKEAYDTLKDGHPTITSAATRGNNFNNYYDQDNSYQAHRDYRDKYQAYQTAYEQRNYRSGDPFKYSDKPWEDLKRDRLYRRQKAYNESFANQGSSLVSITIILSAIAWLVIYSCILLIWDFNSSASRNMTKYKTMSYEDYEAYQDYIKRKEIARLDKLAKIRRARDHELAKSKAAKSSIEQSLVLNSEDITQSEPA